MTNKERWDMNFELVKEYLDEFGRFPNSNESFKNTNIGNWLFRQGYLYRKGKLKQYKIDKLKNINFPFNLRHQMAVNRNTKWEYHVKLFLEFNDKYGRFPCTNDTYKGYDIGGWINYLRNNKAKLSKERIEQLDSIGFIWSSNEYQWMKKYNLLKEYIEEYGKQPSNRTIYKGENLGTWCMSQRGSKKGYLSCKLTEERIQLLDKLNFRWN